MDKKELAEKLKAGAKARRDVQDAEPMKTSEAPQPLSPAEKAKALLRKADSKYMNHISAKLLPSLSEK